MDLMTWIALGNLAINGLGAIWSGITGDQSNKLKEKEMDENLRSNYYSYMDKLSNMRGELSSQQESLNQTMENIATNQNYLDRWAQEYDLTMQSGVDEVFGQYQQMASNLGSGLVSAGETGSKGGSVGLINAMSAANMKAVNGSYQGFNLNNNRLSAFLGSTSLDMLADRQTAMAAVETGYKTIPMYQSAIADLNKAINGNKDEGIAGMSATVEEMRKEIKRKGMTV